MAAEDTWKTLVASQLVREGLVDARVEAPSKPPLCQADECHWQFVVTAGKNGDRTELGTLHVDVKTNEAQWEPNDGRNKRYTIEAYTDYEQARQRVELAVLALPYVKKYCERLRDQHKLDCALWAEQQPENMQCVPKPSVLDDCLWPVYLGEINVDHAVRQATFYVDATNASVVAASPMACGPMPLVKWRAYVAKSRTGKLPPCPDEPGAR
jgi:hypothetical protein